MTVKSFLLLRELNSLVSSSYNKLQAFSKNTKDSLHLYVENNTLPCILKSLLSHHSKNEIKNSIRAYQKIKKLRSRKLSHEFILSFHKLIYKKKEAGQYKIKNNIVKNKNGFHLTTAPAGTITEVAMSDLIKWYNNKYVKLDPIIKIILFYSRFLFIHPFTDGNGRTARLIFLYCLTHHTNKEYKAVAPFLLVDYYSQRFRLNYEESSYKNNLSFNLEQEYDADDFIHFMLKCLINSVKDFEEFLTISRLRKKTVLKNKLIQ